MGGGGGGVKNSPIDSCKFLLLEKFWFISLISTPLIFTPLIFKFCDLIINILLGAFF